MATMEQIDIKREGVLFGLPMPFKFRPPVAMTDEELIAFSRRNKPYQIERNTQGELEIMLPGAEGSHWEAVVISELHLWTRDHGGVSFSSNGGFTLPDGSMRSPDAAWVSDATWNALSRADRRRYAPICPEFLVEILSASDSLPLLEAKMQMWIANGARLAWLIDPYAATVRIYRPGRAIELLDRPDLVEADAVVTGFQLTTRMLWDR